MSSRRSLVLRLIPVLTMAALMSSSCDKHGAGASSSGPTIAESTSGRSTVPASGSLSVDAATINGRTANLDMSVRVVDLYIPDGSQRGVDLDVWAGTPRAGGKKLMTVGYGQVSKLFAPEIPDPQGLGQRGAHVGYSLNFYPTGRTSDADRLMIERQVSSPKQKLTLVAIPGAPAGGPMSVQVFIDDLGTAPDGGDFHAESVPLPPAGRAVLMLGALAMQYRGADKTKWDMLAPSNPAGKCLPFIETENGSISYPTPLTTKLIGGTATLPYLVKAGVPVQINRRDPAQTVEASCTNPPVVAPTDTKLLARQRAYGFVYGPDLGSARLLVVPVV